MSRSASAADVRVGLVLSGGGLRGASHLGVLQELTAQQIPIDVIVGASAGAIVAAYYAAVGLTLDELIADAEQFRGRHLLAHSLNVRLHGRRSTGSLTKRSGIIPERLAQLELATFDRLYHDVRALGVVCHDLTSRRPCYFATGADRGVHLSDVVRASASIPFLLPSIDVTCPDDGVALRLTDGGVSDGLPVAFAQQPPLGATHLIVSDCRWIAGSKPSSSSRLVYVRPRLPSTGTLWAPSSTLASAVREGRRAVDAEALTKIRGWLRAAASN
jgi:NTE family protein